MLQVTLRSAKIQGQEALNYMYLRKIKNKPFFRLIAYILIINFVLSMIDKNIQSVKSSVFKKYENEISILKDDVSNLRFKVSTASSLATIEERAKKIGFIEVNTGIEVITTNYALNLTHEN